MKRMTWLLLLACGCAGRPDEYEPLPPQEPHAAPRDPAAQEPPVGALSLERALTLAERLHPELAMAHARARAAEGRVDQAGRWPNPEAMAGVEKLTEDEEYLAGLSQRFPIGGRLGTAVEVEERERDVRMREMEALRLDVRARVHAAFAAALYAEEARRLQSEALGESRSAVNVAKARLAAGDARVEEAARAEMEEARARVEVERASGLRERALLALAAAIGDPRLSIASLEGALEAVFEVPTLESLLARLESAPLVAAGDADVRAQQARVALAEAERIPDIAVELLYRRIEATDANTFDAGVSVALPLFDRNQGRLREARADVSAAEARARAARNDAEFLVREAHVGLSRALAEVRLLREDLLPRADTVLRGSEARYAAGDVSLADVLPVRRDRIQLRLSYLEALRDVAEALTELKRVLPDIK